MLVPFEHIDVINDIQNVITCIFKYQVNIAPQQTLVAAKRRGHQFLADDLLPVIANQVQQIGGSGGLGITSVDLYIPELNFVFGLASRAFQVAVISLARLESPERERYVQRSIKEAVHELGHALLNLNHCQNSSCVMAFSNCLADTVFKNAEFCARCAARISEKNV